LPGEGRAYRVDLGRAREIGEALRAAGGVAPILRLEEGDPQLHAVARVAARDPGHALLTSVLTALISYRLAARGEEWWSCYGDYFSSQPPTRDPLEAARQVEAFLYDCPAGALAREAKARRVWRAARGAREPLARLAGDPSLILSTGRVLLDPLSKALGQEPWRKTLVFAVKMAYYTARATLRDPVPAPPDTPLPVDKRVACLTVTSGIAPGADPDQVLRRPQPALEAWGLAAGTAGVPPLNLDSLLWLLGWAPQSLPPREAARAIEERLLPFYGPHASLIARELTRKPCPRGPPRRGMRRSHP